jgi:hypothetical protein
VAARGLFVGRKRDAGLRAQCLPLPLPVIPHAAFDVVKRADAEPRGLGDEQTTVRAGKSDWIPRPFSFASLRYVEEKMPALRSLGVAGSWDDGRRVADAAPLDCFVPRIKCGLLAMTGGNGFCTPSLLLTINTAHESKGAL